MADTCGSRTVIVSLGSDIELLEGWHLIMLTSLLVSINVPTVADIKTYMNRYPLLIKSERSGRACA